MGRRARGSDRTAMDRGCPVEPPLESVALLRSPFWRRRESTQDFCVFSAATKQASPRNITKQSISKLSVQTPRMGEQSKPRHETPSPCHVCLVVASTSGKLWAGGVWPETQMM
eukprot:scaffold5790_cov101-Isochrysis_galbana.AAC.5